MGNCLENVLNDFLCICSDAHFVGFTGQEYLRINIHPTYRSHTNDISLRFRTPKESGLLFSTSNRGPGDYLNAFLENGQVKLETNLGGGNQVSR